MDQENSYLHSDMDTADLLQSSEKKTLKKFLLDSEVKQRPLAQEDTKSQSQAEEVKT
jgi:hypothetical protein